MRFKIVIIFFCLAMGILSARDTGLMAREEGWLPALGQEYLAFNFGGYLNLSHVNKLTDSQPDQPFLWDEERASFDYRTSLFRMFIDGSIKFDGKYSEQEPYLGGRYLYINDAYLKMYLPKFTVKAGQGPHRDIVDSPYSLFISSADIPVLHAEMNYQGDLFFFKNRWVSMSYNSSQAYYGTDSLGLPAEGWPNGVAPQEGTLWLDKGMNFKVYGLDFDGWRIGFEDVVVYLDRSFDANYFFNPLPQYFMQLINTEPGVPWVQAGNSKSMLGVFSDITRPGWTANAQILIDDLNLSFLPFVPPRSFKSRVAWSFGGGKVFDWGTLGFHHAGATKYTFSSTRTIESGGDWGAPGYVDVPYSILPYEYTYYPVSEYELKTGESMPIQYEDMYAGYKYGENNLAFMVDYENTLFRKTPYELKLYSYFEFVLNGAKSPVNPWHEFDSTRNPLIEDSSLVLFGDDALEQIWRIKVNLRKKMGNYTFLLDLLAGYVFNGSKLIAVDPSYRDFEDITWTEPKIYVPQSGNHYPVFQLTLGVNYSWAIMDPEKTR